MIATFRETAKSLQDLKYGSVIVKKTGGQVLWYWTKYLIVFLVVACVLGLAALVYYTPQLPKLATDNLPEMTITVKDGKLSTNVPEPFVRGDDNFSFIIDTQGTASQLDKFKTGVLLTADKLIAKTDTETRIMDLEDMEDFTGSKTQVIDWLKSNQPAILVFGLVAIGVVAVVGGGFYWLWNILGMAIWALLLLLAAKILKKTLTYLEAFKIVAYASVLSLLVNIVSFFFPSEILSFAALAAFLFYALAWVYNLHTK